MALTLQLQKPPHSLGGREAGKGEAARQGTLVIPRTKNTSALRSAGPGLGWPLVVLSPIRSHPFFPIKFKNLFFQEAFLDPQCSPFHDRLLEL